MCSAVQAGEAPGEAAEARRQGGGEGGENKEKGDEMSRYYCMEMRGSGG